MRFGYSSLERWFYIARKSDDPVKALRERSRSHAGRLRSVSAMAIQILTAQWREHQNWSALLHADNLAHACSLAAALPQRFYPTAVFPPAPTRYVAGGAWCAMPRRYRGHLKTVFVVY